MKKRIIWIFGESATGKLTLINNLYNKDVSTLSIFDMSDKKIDISKITLEDRTSDYGNIEDHNNYDDSLMEEDNLYFNREDAIQRRSCIMYDTNKFLKNDNDILLIKGQVNDMNIKRGNIVSNFLNKYSNLDNIKIEVYILTVNNPEELRRRIASKPWFKEMDNEEEKMRLLQIIPSKQEKHKEDVINAFDIANVDIYQVESLDGTYKIDGIVNGKVL